MPPLNRKLYLEDFEAGQRFSTRGCTLSEAQILQFAWEHDPQPFHIDKEAAAASLYGGLIASGFQQIEIRYRAPYPEHEKLQPLPASPALGDSVETLNANVEKINRLLFTHLDYAAIGRRS